MYEELYVRRKRKKKIAAVVVGISTVGVTSLAIISFLGRYVGTFTVSLRNQEVALTLSQKSDFEKTTTYLRLSAVPRFDESTYSKILAKQPDNEEFDYTYGASHYDSEGNIDAYDFFKYTFFVKNIGTADALYDFKIKLSDDKPADTSGGNIYLSDLLRVMVYENDVNDEHAHTVYAKPKGNDEDTVHKTKDGEVTNREFISTRPKSVEMVESEEYPLAENFYDNSTVVNYVAKPLEVGQYRRYTLVTWLEGEDPQSSPNKEAPLGATIKLGVEIPAYEN